MIDGYRITGIKGVLQLKKEQEGGGRDALTLKVQKLEHLVDELLSRDNAVIECEKEGQA